MFSSLAEFVATAKSLAEPDEVTKVYFSVTEKPASTTRQLNDVQHARDIVVLLRPGAGGW